MFYIVKIRAHQRMLATIAGVFEEDRKAGDVMLLSVEPEAEAPPPVARQRHMKYENGKRNKGVGAQDLLLSLMPTVGSMVSRRTAQEVFRQRGFNPHSATSAASILKSNGKLEYRPDGYARVG